MDETILTIISFLLGGGTIGALITWWANRKKVDAEADSIFVESVTKASKAMLGPLTERVTCLEGDLDTERSRRMKLSDELEQAKRESDEANHRQVQRILALERAILDKDKEIAILQEKVKVLEAQLEALEQTPVTNRNGKKPGTGPLPEPVK